MAVNMKQQHILLIFSSIILVGSLILLIDDTPKQDADWTHCFPKDLSAIISLSEKLKSNNITLKSVMESNNKVRKNKDWQNMKGRAVI